MERDVAVTRGEIRVPLVRRHVAVPNEDVLAPAGDRGDAFELIRLPVTPVDALEDEDRALAWLERLDESLDDGGRILALPAPEVEDEEEREPVRQAELGLVLETDRAAAPTGTGTTFTGMSTLAATRLTDVVARHPELVEEPRRAPVPRD